MTKQYFSVIALGGILVIFLCAQQTYAQTCGPCTLDPGPACLNDSNSNFANCSSSISWGPLPSGKPYTTDSSYDDAGLGPLFDMSRNFLKILAGGGDLNYELLKTVLADFGKIGDHISDFVPLFVGFGICFVLGLGFFFLMPLIGLCFCCCRTCCGNCGGKREWKESNTEGAMTWKIVHSVGLLLCTLFMAVGMICTYVTNDKMTTALEETSTIIDTNLDDLGNFLNNTIKQIEYVANEGFGFTRKVVIRDLDNIGHLVGVPVRNTLGAEGGIDAAINSIIAFDTIITTVGSALTGFNTSLTAGKAAFTKLGDDFNNVSTQLTATLASCGAPCSGQVNPADLDTDVNFDSLPDISGEMSQLESVMQQNITALALTGKKQFDDIPQRVTNETTSTVQSIKDMLNSFDGTITNALGGITNLTQTFNINDMKTQITDPLKQASDYEKFRWYGGVGLTCIILLIVVLQFFGLFFGICGHSKETLYPDTGNRGCLSNAGGNMLMASVGFIFIFSWLLMLLVLLVFALAFPIQTFVCGPMTDPEMKMMKELLDGPGGVFNQFDETKGYFLGQTLFQNSSINLTFSGLLTDCKNNKAAYTAMRLEAMFDLDTVIDYKSSIDIDSQLDSIKDNVDLTTVNILTPETEKQMTDFRDSLNIDYDSFESELSSNTTKVDLLDFANKLDNLATIATGAGKNAEAAQFTAQALQLRTIQNTSVQDVNQAQVNLRAAANTLKNSTASIPAKINSTIDTVKGAENYIHTNATGVITKEAKTYADRVLGAADQFAAEAETQVKTGIGQCTPLWNLWHSIMDVLICQIVANTINGFYFSFGWCIFFMIPSCIFSVKLVKYLRDMRPSSYEDDPNAEAVEMKSNGKGHYPSDDAYKYKNGKVSPV